MTINEYTYELHQAILSNYQNIMGEGGIYHGKEGIRRLARDYGRGLSRSSKKEIEYEIQNSYGSLLVMVTNMKPLLDAKEWNDEVRKGLEGGEWE